MPTISAGQARAEGQRLSWAVVVLTLAAITSSSLSALSLYHVLALQAEVEGLRTEVSRRREEQTGALEESVSGPERQQQEEDRDSAEGLQTPDVSPPELQADVGGRQQEKPSLKKRSVGSESGQSGKPFLELRWGLPELGLLKTQSSTIAISPLSPVRHRGDEHFKDVYTFQPCLQMMADGKREVFQKEFALQTHTGVPWQTGLKRGSALDELQDAILVKEEGYFFIYSQVEHCDPPVTEVFYKDPTFAMGHIVIRMKKNVVGDESQHVVLFRCIQSMNLKVPYNTCFTGGIAKLEAGDRVELLIPRPTANISLDGDSTYLGAIKLD